jgi:hypothetical protein
MSNVSLMVASSADRNFRFDLPGKVPDILFCDGKCTNAKELDVNSGGGKWMYDQAARSFGHDPTAARQWPELNAKVMDRLSQTIDGLIADAKNGGAPTPVEWHSSFRSQLTQVARAEDSKITGSLHQHQLEKIAALPGAGILSDPAVRGAVHIAINAEQRVLTNAAPQLGAAARAGSAAGTLATVAIAEFLAPDAPPVAGDKPAEAPKSDATTQRPALNPTVALLDVNKDDRLQCKEIGIWVKDNGFDSRSVNSKAYQDFISGKPGMDFEVNTPVMQSGKINFDGCKDMPAGALLLEAKAQHGAVLTGGWSSAPAQIADQARKQDQAAKALGVQNEWHVQVKEEAATIRIILEHDVQVKTPVHHTDMPIVKK